MKKLVICALLFIGAIEAFAAAPGPLGNWGLGAEVGGESSISMQNVYTEGAAITFGFGTYGLDQMIYGDHLWYLSTNTIVHPYLGMGLGLSLFNETIDSQVNRKSDLRGVVRLIAGASYYAMDPSLNIYGQIVPSFDTENVSDAYAQVGMRYFFQ